MGAAMSDESRLTAEEQSAAEGWIKAETLDVPSPKNTPSHLNVIGKT